MASVRYYYFSKAVKNQALAQFSIVNILYFLLRKGKSGLYLHPPKGGMAEWSNAAVLKTVEGHTSGGSNPSSSAKKNPIASNAMGFFSSCVFCY